MEGKQGRAAGFRRGSLPAARARGARELEEIETNLLVGLGGVRDSRRRLVGREQGTAAEVCSTAVMFRQGSTMRGGGKAS